MSQIRKAGASGTLPSVIAHRAGGVQPTGVTTAVPDAVAPENTIEGIHEVAAGGAHAVEMDVRWSKGDGTANYPGWPVLMHDPTVDRTTNGTGAVASLGLTALQALFAQDYAPFKGQSKWASVHVPYAWSFLDQLQVDGVDGLLHINIPPNRVQADKLMYYVGLFPALNGHLTFMGDADVLGPMHGWYPSLTYAYIEYPPSGTIRAASAIHALGANIYVLPIQNADLDAAAVAYWHAAGIQVWTWSSDLPTYDTQANWQKAADLGIDALITNRAPQASAYYAGIGSA